MTGNALRAFYWAGGVASTTWLVADRPFLESCGRGLVAYVALWVVCEVFDWAERKMRGV